MWLLHPATRNIRLVQCYNVIKCEISSGANGQQIAKPVLRKQKQSKYIGPFGWFLLASLFSFKGKRKKYLNLLFFRVYQLQHLLWAHGKFRGRSGRRISFTN